MEKRKTSHCGLLSWLVFFVYDRCTTVGVWLCPWSQWTGSVLVFIAGVVDMWGGAVPVWCMVKWVFGVSTLVFAVDRT